jgi:hypothetical protein
MLGLIGIVILLVLLWRQSGRARGILNIAQQRGSGALAI